MLLHFGIQPGQRFEEMTLVRIVKRFAEIQVLQLVTAILARCQATE